MQTAERAEGVGELSVKVRLHAAELEALGPPAPARAAKDGLDAGGDQRVPRRLRGHGRRGRLVDQSALVLLFHDAPRDDVCAKVSGEQ